MSKSIKRIVFLVGAPRVGKTTVIQKVMALARRFHFLGFITIGSENIRESSQPRSFKLILVDGRHRFAPSSPEHCLIGPIRNSSPDITFFRQSELLDRGLRILRNPPSVESIIVMDEIGGLQLSCAGFEEKLNEFVESNHILLAAAVDGFASRDDRIGSILARNDCIKFEVTRTNRCILPGLIVKHLNKLRVEREQSPLNVSSAESAASLHH